MASSVREKLLVQLGLDATQFQRDMKKSTKNIEEIRRSSDKLGKSFSKLKKLTVTGFAGWGISKIAKDIISTGLSFESTMKTVQAWSGATGRELQSLENIARKMGATTEWSAKQSADALKYLAAAGFSVEESIAALPQTLDLATAGQVDLATASDIATDVLTAFGMEVSELSRVNDAFITTASNSNTNVLKLGESFKMVAPTAKLMGLTIEQTAGMLGTLANSGIKAEMAGSGLNMALLRATKAAKMLGMDAATPLVDVLKRMKEEQWDATKIGKAFGSLQVKTVGILMDNIKMFEDLTKKIIENKGATQKLAKIIRDSVGNSLKTLQSAIQELALKTFDIFKSNINSVAESLSAAARRMGEWVEKNKEFIRNGIVGTIESLITVLKSAIPLVEKIGATFGVIIAAFNALPDYIKGPTGVGLITWALFGPTAAGIVAGIALLDQAGKKIIEVMSNAEVESNSYQKRLEKVDEKLVIVTRNLKYLKEQLEEGTGNLKIQREQLKEYLTAYDELIKEKKILTKAVEVETEQIIESANAWKFFDKEAQEAFKKGKKYLEDADKRLNNSNKDRVDAWKRTARKLTDEEKKMFDAMEREGELYYENQEDLNASLIASTRYTTDQMIDEAKKGAWESANSWREGFEQIDLSIIETEDNFDAFIRGAKEGLESFEDSLKTTYENGKKVTEDFVKAGKNSLSDGFFKILKGDISDLGDVFQSFIDSMLKSLSDFAASEVVKWFLNINTSKSSSGFGGILTGILGGIGKIFGFQEGGIIPGMIGEPKLVVAHGGEIVIPPDKVESFDSWTGPTFKSRPWGANVLDPAEYFPNAMLAGGFGALTGGLPGFISGMAGSILRGGIKESLGLRGKWFDVPSILTQFMGGPAGGFLSPLVGILGDLTGDLFNVRGYEPLRDMFEDVFGYKGGRQEFARGWDAIGSISDIFGTSVEIESNLSKGWHSLKEMAEDFERVGNYGLADITRSAMESLEKDILSMQGWTEEEIQSAYGSLGDTMGYLSSASDTFSERAITSIENTQNNFTNATTGLSSGYTNLVNETLNNFEEITGFTLDEIEETTRTINDLIDEKTVSILKSYEDLAITQVDQYENVKDIGTKSYEEFSKAFASMGVAAIDTRGITKTVLDVLEETQKQINDYATETLDDFKTSINEAADTSGGIGDVSSGPSAGADPAGLGPGTGFGFASGLDFVPKEGYYYLHPGERVQTAQEANVSRSGSPIIIQPSFRVWLGDEEIKTKMRIETDTHINKRIDNGTLQGTSVRVN